MSTPIEIICWQPSLAHAFHDINEAWISEMFSLEDHDREVLEDPQCFIIDRGGEVLFARRGAGVVGTCALMPTDDGAIELTKMGVVPGARGQGVGESLLVAALERARSLPQRPLFLLTNRRCASAIRLYEKLGFAHDRDIMSRYGASYARCDVAMRYLESNA